MRRQPTVRLLWLEWTLATLVGYAVGILVALPWAVDLAYAAQPGLLIGLAGGAVLGAAVGGLQWLVLRRHARQVDGWWVLASIVGGSLGLALGMALADALTLPSPRVTDREAATLIAPLGAALRAGVTGAVLGVVLGGAQWLVLRRTMHLAGWWIIANFLGWLAGMGVGAALAEVVSVIGALVVTGVTVGVVTGSVMQYLVRQVETSSGPDKS